jgi:type I restriction enzyme S subunit
MTGSTGRQRLSAKDLAAISLNLPPIHEQRRIVDLIGSFDSQLASLDSQIASAQLFRSGVLSELLSGRRLLDESYDVAVSL